MVVRLHRAGVRALVIHVHVLDLDAVLGLGVAQENHSWVQAPLVIPSVEDGAAVQPGYPGDPVVNRAPGGKARWSSQDSGSHQSGVLARAGGVFMPCLQSLPPVYTQKCPLFALSWTVLAGIWQGKSYGITALAHWISQTSGPVPVKPPEHRVTAIVLTICNHSPEASSTPRMAGPFQHNQPPFAQGCP